LSSKIIEPLQSRCAILRFVKPSDAQILKRLKQIIEAENVQYSDDGLSALLFSAEGDMRQAINNLQSTFQGFHFVNGENVFKVVDQPHPVVIARVLQACAKSELNKALDEIEQLSDKGYTAIDLVTTMFKVSKTVDGLQEQQRLLFLKEIGLTHLRVLEGLNTRLQVFGLISRLCQ